MWLSWKKVQLLSILLGLCMSHSSNVSCASDDAELPESPVMLELREAREARRAAERRNVELQMALSKQQQELQDLHRLYATLYVASREQQDELQQMELHIAGLLSEHEDISGGQALSRALAALDELRKQQQELGEALSNFGHYLHSVLDTLQCSETLRRDVTARLQALIVAAERSVKPLSLVAGRDSRDVSGAESRILAVNHDLKVAVLDRGADDGVRKGSTWKVMKGDTLLARLKVMEVRPAISAAMVIDGKLDALGPGVLAQRSAD